MGQLSTCCVDYSNILDDDSLLNTFYLYRPFLLGEDQDEDTRLMGGEWQWVGENWWYKLTHVCQRWRELILGSAFYLGLSLVCTKSTPISDMLAHSPPLPLVIDYFDKYHDITAEDKEGLILGPSRSSQLTSSTNSRFPSHISCCL